jgi:phosphoadenosine phosphosulfate reductase
LRRQQSAARAAIGVIELYHFDDASGKEIVKLNAVANWSRDDLWKYIRQHRIPFNPLHDLGYRSIGCIPCTRRALADPDERAGRWSGFKKVECGIHTFMSRRTGDHPA